MVPKLGKSFNLISIYTIKVLKYYDSAKAFTSWNWPCHMLDAVIYFIFLTTETYYMFNYRHL